MFYPISKGLRTISFPAAGLEIVTYFICEAVWNNLKNNAMDDTAYCSGFKGQDTLLSAKKGNRD